MFVIKWPVAAVLLTGKRLLRLSFDELHKPQPLDLLFISMLGHFKCQLHPRSDLRYLFLSSAKFLCLLVEFAS